MIKDLKDLKVAIVSDHFWSFVGSQHVTKEIGKLFNNPDYYFLFGDRRIASDELDTKNIYFSRLQRIPFIKNIYRYTYFLWPTFIESFDFSKYDLVISSSFSVSHGVVTGINTKHISYIHTPMRYAWDLSFEYFNRRKLSFFKCLVIPFFLNYIRIWDVVSSNRSDLLIANSQFVLKRMKKYWKRDADIVVYPPVDLYKGKVFVKRKNYFVIGSPFDVNKKGEFVLQCAKDLKFNLKVLGNGSGLRRMKKSFGNCKNIEFLGRVSEEEKFNLLSHAKGFIAAGVEDFGIFPVEAMSCGTPVLAYGEGGYLESVSENVSGIFFREHTLSSFKEGLRRLEKKNWNYLSISKSVRRFSSMRFEKEMREYILKNI